MKKRIVLTKDDKKQILRNYRGCYRKRQYESKELAESVVFKMKYKNTKNSAYLGSYQCKICGKFHVGKQL